MAIFVRVPGFRHAQPVPHGLVSVWPVLVVAIWFLALSAPGILAGFTSDDLMNLHGHVKRGVPQLLHDNVAFYSTAYRPLGGLFYATFYSLFGLNPLPYRLACFALLLFNLWLAYSACLVANAPRRVAFLATLLGAYHAWFVELYYNTGTIYDLLCFTFYFLAFISYGKMRQNGRTTWAAALRVTALYLCALNAKEMGATLPVILFAAELILYPGCLPQKASTLRRRLFERFGVVALLSVLTLLYAYGKTGPGSLNDQPAYRLHLSAGKYLDTFHLYLNPLLYQDHFFRDSNTVQLLGAMLALAFLLRSRQMIFSWIFIVVSILPVAFIEHYAALFLYIPIFGWTFYAASALDSVLRPLRRWLFPVPAASHGKWLAAAALAAFGTLGWIHFVETAKTRQQFKMARPDTKGLLEQIRFLQPDLPRGAHVLFLNDHFLPDDHLLVFLVRLLYHDLTIEVERQPAGSTVDGQKRNCDAVFSFQRRQLIKVP